MKDTNINAANKQVSLWLFSCSFLILLMVLVGGYTRLTDSGLSMTNWHPINGIIPPLNTTSWLAEFAQYQQSPEYLKININIGLAEFKQIFWAEYWHRILGRIIGLFFFIPFLYFVIRRKVSKITSLKLLAIALLIGGQGLMGWYMVQSGLIDNPHVSHYRLAAHLLLAMVIYSLIIIFAFKLHFNKKSTCYLANIKLKNCTNLFLIFILLIFLQTMLGAFVAGLDAGLIYNSFPLMNGELIPSSILWLDHMKFFDNPAMVQFLHRVNAIFMSLLGAFLYFYSYKKLPNNYPKILLHLFIITLAIQFFLGVSTLIYSVPLALGMLHQFFAFILVALSIISYYRIKIHR